MVLTCDLTRLGTRNACVTDQILAIYDADFTVLGEIAYAIGKVTGIRSCALCDVSHGLNPLGKKNWRSYRGTRPEIEWIHRNDLDDDTRAALVCELPCVIAKDSLGGCHMLLDNKEIRACHGDITQFDARLSNALAQRLIVLDDARAS